jgi:hypothetical protein
LNIRTDQAIITANGGLHSQRALETAHGILTRHDLRQPVLFHLVFTGGQIANYQATVKALVRRLRTYGCRCEYFGAYEAAEDKGGIHAHCFVLIETSKKQPFEAILNVNDGKYLHKLADRHKIDRIHVAKPKNPIHDGQFFARPVEAGGKLANCLAWVQYIYKNRSKADVARRETYFNSEFYSNTAKRMAAKQAAGYVAVIA